MGVPANSGRVWLRVLWVQDVDVVPVWLHVAGSLRFCRSLSLSLSRSLAHSCRSYARSVKERLTVGGSINNALFIGRECGSSRELRLFVSNNDKNVKGVCAFVETCASAASAASVVVLIAPRASPVFGLPSLRLESDIRFPTSINYFALSGDGELAVAVGDSKRVFLLECRRWVLGEYATGNGCGDM